MNIQFGRNIFSDSFERPLEAAMLISVFLRTTKSQWKKRLNRDIGLFCLLRFHFKYSTAKYQMNIQMFVFISAISYLLVILRFITYFRRSFDV